MLFVFMIQKCLCVKWGGETCTNIVNSIVYGKISKILQK
jgi:hypothetical protein